MPVPRSRLRLPAASQALPGRVTPLRVPPRHLVNGRSLLPPWPEGLQWVLFGMGCFWGAERRFWGVPGVHVTMVGYAGGFTQNPTYEEVCSGLTGHAEVVRVVYDPQAVDFQALLVRFWEGHDPTQGMRQGNDVGTQYRSCILCASETQRLLALKSREAYERALERAGWPRRITTEVRMTTPFYYAEAVHQQYLARNPRGYCGLGGTGVPWA